MTDNATTLLLTKIAPIFLYPVGAAIMLILLGITVAFFHHRRLSMTLFATAAGGLWIASTPVFADWAISTLEQQYPAQALADTKHADVAIVLGGAMSQPAPPRVQADLNKSFDRVLQAIQLYKAGLVQEILVTGGNVPWRPDIVPEAELIRTFLIDWGVPADDIQIAGQSRNTYENALEIKALWEKKPFESALLITSASHMPRAMAVFQKADLPVAAATTDIEALKGVPPSALRWLPDASSLTMTTNAMKEWIGYWAYRARGYL